MKSAVTSDIAFSPGHESNEALQSFELPRRTRKRHLRSLSEPDSAKPGAAQILKGISLVTFFVPAKKVTRWPKDSGSFGLPEKVVRFTAGKVEALAFGSDEAREQMDSRWCGNDEPRTKTKRECSSCGG